MAKTPKNAEKFPIRWNGYVEGGENQGDSIPSSKRIVWGDNPYTWGDVAFVIEISDGLGTGRRRQDKLDTLLKDEKKKSFTSIIRIKRRFFGGASFWIRFF